MAIKVFYLAEEVFNKHEVKEKAYIQVIINPLEI
jgi:hypothetical protein